jgi:hypothetical protein
MPATTELLSRYRPVREYNKSSSREILFPKNEKTPKHTRGRSPYRKCPPYSLDRDETPYASPIPLISRTLEKFLMEGET